MQMYFARRTDAAERDLQELACHIAIVDNRPHTADRVIESIVSQCHVLAELSETSRLGVAVPELGADVRAFPFKRWIILFRYEAHGVDILRIADAKQDFLSWRL